MPRLFNDPASGLTLPVRGDPPSGSPVITQGYGPENTDPSGVITSTWNGVRATA